MSSELSGQRRLTSIVAIDVAGYSARAEADEAAAAAQIAALSTLISTACEAHGGRIFNMAGDGFMLEFPTASGALEAAEAIARDAALPVRIGVHLGEVLVTPTGDLLGHGVNVAARIQALAPARGILVSADVQRAIRGPLAERLIDKGMAPLDKMDETVRLFALASPGTRRPRPAPRLPRVLRRRRVQVMAAAAVLLFVLAGGLWLLRERIWPPPALDARVAVLPFKVLSADPQTRFMADGLVDEITRVLSNNRTLTISAAMPEGAAAGPAAVPDATYVLEGSVEHDGPTLTVRIRLSDPRRRLTLWSDTLSGPAATPTALQTEVAAKTTDIVGFALDARRRGGETLDEAALADFLRGNALLVFNGPAGAPAARSAFQGVVARAPRFARGHAVLAVACVIMARTAPADQAAALRRESSAEAHAALAIDPNDGWAYQALSEASAQMDWSVRERLYEQGIAVDPNSPFLRNTHGYFLTETGRTREGLAEIDRGLAINALHPGSNYVYAVQLAGSGRYGEARDRIEILVRNWPKPWTDEARLALVMIYGPPDEAAALLRQSQAHPYVGEGPTLAAWAVFLPAAHSRDPAVRARAAAAMLAAARAGAIKRSEAMLALAILGDSDGAFALADLPFASDGETIVHAFFAGPGAPLRRDPRFWPLMVRLRLVDYWRSSGHWPDVCASLTGPEACPIRAELALRARS